jgi:hypothetical protein
MSEMTSDSPNFPEAPSPTKITYVDGRPTAVGLQAHGELVRALWVGVGPHLDAVDLGLPRLDLRHHAVGLGDSRRRRLGELLVVGVVRGAAVDADERRELVVRPGDVDAPAEVPRRQRVLHADVLEALEDERRPVLGDDGVPNTVAGRRSEPMSVPDTIFLASVPVPDGAVTQAPAEDSDIFIQAGAFLRYDNANRLRARLSQLAAVRIEPATVNGREYFRVRLGPVDDVAAADRLLALMLENGYARARVVVD